MGKKSKKTKWLPLNLENIKEKVGRNNDDSSSTTTQDSSSEKEYYNLNRIDSDNYILNSQDEIPPSCTPTGSYYPLVKHPVYALAIPIPHGFHTNFLSQNTYRPLQPLHWFNQRIPANCQIFHAMAPQVPRYVKPRRDNRDLFYWNNVLINPYSNFTTTNSESSTSGYVYPGHYYGPSSLSVATDSRSNLIQTSEDNTHTGERRIQSKKRKRKRKRKLRLKTTSSSLLDVANVSSFNANGLMDIKEIDGSHFLPEMQLEEEKSTMAVDVCTVHMSRDQLPHLPLVDDLFAVTFVDEIISKAVEIAIEKENSRLLIRDTERNVEEVNDWEDNIQDEIEVNRTDDSVDIRNGELDWIERNGHVDEAEDDNGERELVTEIVFVSETSFMDESNVPDEEVHECEVEEDKVSELSSKLSSNASIKDEDEEEEEFVGETYMDIDDRQQFYDPQKLRDYYQICTNVDVPDSPFEKSDKSAKPLFEVVTNQPLPKPKEIELPNRHAEIVVHELDDNVSECGSEDVDVIGHRYQKSETNKNIYVNQLSLAAELLKAQQDIPYDEELKPIENSHKLNKAATASHSILYDSFDSNVIEMKDVNTCKEVSDSGVQSEESGDEQDSRTKATAHSGTNRSVYKEVFGSNAKPLSSMLKKSETDPLCLCCSIM